MITSFSLELKRKCAIFVVCFDITLGIDWKNYRFFCFNCHRNLSDLCLNKDELFNKIRLEELIETDNDEEQEPIPENEFVDDSEPKVTTGSFCLD